MVKQQALVIGLGQFGMALAEALTNLGTEVIAIDRRSDRAQRAGEFASQAIAMDGMDEAELARLRPGTRDLCVCAIGDESREASIITTALLRQLGAKRIVARATNELHERILHLVGAHEVIHPERTFGERLASRLSCEGVLDVLPLGEDLVITELLAPHSTLGRSLGELHLPRRFQLTVLAVRRSGGARGSTTLPRADLTLQAGDVVVCVGPAGAARRLIEES